MPTISTEFMQRITPASPRQVLFERFSKQTMNALGSNNSPTQSRPLVLLTGGLRSPAHFTTALSSSHADLLGVGRGAILRPDFPDVLADRLRLGKSKPDGYYYDTQPVAVEPYLKNESTSGDHRRSFLFWCWAEVGDRVWRWVCPRIPLVGAGVDVAWYTVAMRRWATIVTVGGPTGVVVERLTEDGSGSRCAPELDYEMSGIGAVVRMWVFAVWTEDDFVRWTRGGVFVAVLVLLLVLVLGFLDDSWCFRSWADSSGA
jgi:hypothetical protein